VTNFKIQLRDALWDLLEANADVVRLVKAGNRIKANNEAGWLKELWDTSAASGYPRLTITSGRWTNSGFTQDSTFATEGVDFLGDFGAWPLQRILTFRIICVSRDLKLDAEDDLEETVQTALLNGGPKFGFQWVTGWTMDANDQERTSRNEANGTQRLITRIRLPITCQFEGADIIAAA
jgi:hypothetical protein